MSQPLVTKISLKNFFVRFYCNLPGANELTHLGQVMHICVIKLTIIGSDNGLSPGRRQAIFWTNVGILLIGLLGTNFSEILMEIVIFSFKKMRLKVLSGKWRPFCLGRNVLISEGHIAMLAAPVTSSVWMIWVIMCSSITFFKQGHIELVNVLLPTP